MTAHPPRAALALCLLALVMAPQISFAAGGSVRHYPQLAKPSGDMRLRAGPGSNFPQIDVVRRGEAITVRSCSAGWCQINQQDGGPAGFMTDAYLIFLGEIRG